MFQVVDPGPEQYVWGKIMHARSILFTAILAVTATACSERTTSGQSSISTTTDRAVSRPANPDQAPRAIASQHSNVGGPNDSNAVAQRLCTGDCRDAGPLEAKSQEEAEWLIRHKYPSQAELERLRSESLDILQQKASAGDPTAAAVLGKRIAMEKNFMDGQVMLRNQVLSGNFYALYAISESYRESKVPNPVDGAAYLRLAYIMGDHKAAIEIAKMRLSSAELAAADSRASLLYKGFAGDQAPDPRPQG
ncbi:hypothetical protein [Stenotrophomonas maltophilia]|uniref:Tetratricopeptide repeat protein n=1 Tax=Stenotrophomonas maltophilia TaxID=40324 RepID=A0AAJ2JEP9_STEMA|nr:hypothetical protein [Stenotrophomonas maltophilia]MDT3470029.1 hypothetical protein [Stenotrophomonas maltophilia]